MTVAQLRASLRLWQARLAYRRRRHRFYHHKSRRPEAERKRLAEKWHRLEAEARRMVDRRRQQIRERTRPRFYYTRHRPQGHADRNGNRLKVGPVRQVAGHYTADQQDRSTRDARAKVEGLARYHHNKWGDWLEYHVVVTVDGDLIWNRPTRLLGYGVGGSNTGTLHVVCLGTRGDKPTSEQRQAVRWLADNWHTRKVPRRFRVPRDLRRVPWKGHKDFPPPGGNTECPGDFTTMYRTRGARR